METRTSASPSVKAKSPAPITVTSTVSAPLTQSMSSERAKPVANRPPRTARAASADTPPVQPAWQSKLTEKFTPAPPTTSVPSLGTVILAA